MTFRVLFQATEEDPPFVLLENACNPSGTVSSQVFHHRSFQQMNDRCNTQKDLGLLHPWPFVQRCTCTSKNLLA